MGMMGKGRHFTIPCWIHIPQNCFIFSQPSFCLYINWLFNGDAYLYQSNYFSYLRKCQTHTQPFIDIYHTQVLEGLFTHSYYLLVELKKQQNEHCRNWSLWQPHMVWLTYTQYMIHTECDLITSLLRRKPLRQKPLDNCEPTLGEGHFQQKVSEYIPCAWHCQHFLYSAHQCKY